MPGPTAIITTARKIPWAKVLIAGQYVYRKGSSARAALTEAERKEFLGLLRKSRGFPQNLIDRERARAWELAGKALDGARQG